MTVTSDANGRNDDALVDGRGRRSALFAFDPKPCDFFATQGDIFGGLLANRYSRGGRLFGRSFVDRRSAVIHLIRLADQL